MKRPLEIVHTDLVGPTTKRVEKVRNTLCY
jgi:hypothetical protein